MSERWLMLGSSPDTRGEELPVAIPMDALKLHMAVLGATGSGKSTFLRNLALQFFDAGGDVIVIEPHGDPIYDPEEGLLVALQAEQLAQVTLLDLGSRCPPQINLATAGRSAGRAAAVETAARCIQVMDDTSWEANIRMREILENALHLLLVTQTDEGEEPSLLALQQFLTRPDVRAQQVERAQGARGYEILEVRDYWQRTLESWENSKDGGASILEVPQRRLRQFFGDPTFYRTLALPALAPEQELDIARMLDDPEPRMILVPLHRLGTDVAKRVVGTLFMQMVLHAFFARAHIPREKRRQTLVILDEFATLAGGAVGEMTRVLLAQARKFGASLVLGMQSLSQLPREVRDEVKNNTNHKVVLMTAGPDDAKLAVELLGSDQLTATDVGNIERFAGYARLHAHGPQPPCYFRAQAPLPRVPDAGRPRAARPTPPPQHPALGELLALHTQAAEAERTGAAGPFYAGLRHLSNDQFAALVAAQLALNAHTAVRLVAEPDLIPDPVARVQLLSAARHGLPAWLREAQYQRLYG